MTLTRRIAAALGVLAVMGGAPATAGEAQDRIFAMGVLDEVQTGASLVYRHDRSGATTAGAGLTPVEDGEVRVQLKPSGDTEGRDAVVSLREGERFRILNPFPAAAGNPLLMVFMETSVRSMAAASGGSPFYIRNRMREALRTQDEGAPVEALVDGAAVPATRYAFRPFAGDPNAAKMGPFAALEMAFTLSDAAPGRFLSMEAVAGPDASGAPAFRESFVWQGTEVEG